jgi:hypothetical protein
LIRRKFVIASSFRIILSNTSTIVKTISITTLSPCIPLIRRKLEIGGCFSEIDMFARLGGHEKPSSNPEHGIRCSLQRSACFHLLRRS